jgi:large subunit ribosomal protein L29
MKLSEIRAMDKDALNERIVELKSELAREKALVAGGTRPENPGKIKSVRKTIARIFTVIKEKEKAGKKSQKKER